MNDEDRKNQQQDDHIKADMSENPFLSGALNLHQPFYILRRKKIDSNQNVLYH